MAEQTLDTSPEAIKAFFGPSMSAPPKPRLPGRSWRSSRRGLNRIGST